MPSTLSVTLDKETTITVKHEVGFDNDSFPPRDTLPQRPQIDTLVLLLLLTLLSY